jgi:hypothetical protein
MITSPAAGEELLQGHYDCVGASQGSCGEGPAGICLGATIRRDGPNLFLSLDFERNEALLNGIHGSIRRDQAGAIHLYWSDLRVLGQQRLTMLNIGGNIIARLGLVGPTADFSCQRLEPARR